MQRSIFLAATLALGALALGPARLAAQTGPLLPYAMDPGHSSAEFKVEHLVVSNVRGTIPISEGIIEVGTGTTVPARVAATLDAAGLDTKNPDRDKDLRSSDWFDVSKYPTIAFKSTQVAAGTAPGSFSVTGDLTLHGVTKSVVLACSTVGTTVDARGFRHIGYTATTTVDRRDFGMNLLKTTPGGNLIAGTTVAISLEIEVVQR